jgi:lipoprotein-releasing system permease protein
MDAIWVSAAALTVSFLATLYPARRATAVLPAEALRYE